MLKSDIAVVDLFSSFLRLLHIEFHNSCTSFQSHQERIRVPFPPCSLQHLSSIVFFIFVILTWIWWNFSCSDLHFCNYWGQWTIFGDISSTVYFFWELSIQFPAPPYPSLFNGLFVLFWFRLSAFWVICIFWILIVYHMDC